MEKQKATFNLPVPLLEKLRQISNLTSQNYSTIVARGIERELERMERSNRIVARLKEMTAEELAELEQKL